MIDEKYLQMAINIRKTYLSLINNIDLYSAKASAIAQRLNDTIAKIDEIQKQAEDLKENKSSNSKDLVNKLLNIINDIEDEGKRLENIIAPMNVEIEKLSKEESELYRLIVNNYPNLTEDEIVKSVQDRLILEGLSQ